MKKKTNNRAKNLIKKDGLLINQHGVEFTEQEKKRLVSLVNSATRKRRNELNKYKDKDIYYMGDKVGEYSLNRHILEENDFLLKKKSKSLQRFKDKTSFNTYIENLERVTKRDYIDKRLSLYRDNYNSAIDSGLEGLGDEYKAKVNSLTNKEFSELIMTDEGFQIGYLYKAKDVQNKIEQLNGMIDNYIKRKESLKKGKKIKSKKSKK